MKCVNLRNDILCCPGLCFVRFGLTVARYYSVIGRNALFCCDRYIWSLDDLLRGTFIEFCFSNTRHNLVNDNMIQTESFLYEMSDKEFLNFVKSQIFSVEITS